MQRTTTVGRAPIAVFIVILVLFGALLIPASLRGSSHREAPLISKDPTADNTDLYAFVTPNDPNTVTIIANWIPAEEPTGGPNFYNFDPNALYEIKIDNNGDAVEDITYQFRFKTQIANPNTFLYNTGQVTSVSDADLNLRQTYTMTRVTNGSSKALNKSGQTLRVAPYIVGPRSTPKYPETAATAIYDVRDSIRVFAGPRDDPFFVDIGSIFDLGGLRPFNPAHVIPLPAAPGIDSLGGFNVHSIAIRVPRSQLGEKGNKNDTIGIYATTSRQKTTVLNANGTVAGSGDWQQVSRLGNPLVNEVIIPLAQKDKWNFSDPEDDQQFVKNFTNPELARLINQLYPSLPNAAETGRTDLVAVLNTGVKGLNFTGTKPADLLRLNMGIAPCVADNAADVRGKCSRLGALGGDLSGFPNGRRLTDDVTDIEIRAVAQGYGPALAKLLGLPNKNPNNDLGDGVNVNDVSFMSSFPFVATPYSSYEHGHHKVGSTDTGRLAPN